MGVEEELVTRSGTWYSIGKERIGQGRERAVQFLRDHPELSDRLDIELRTRFFAAPSPKSEKGKEKEKETESEKVLASE